MRAGAAGWRSTSARSRCSVRPGPGRCSSASDFGLDRRQGVRGLVFTGLRDGHSVGGRSDSHGQAGAGVWAPIPAMDTFGAQRVRAEFPASMDRKDTTATHNAYFDFQETDGPGTRQWLVTPANAVRSESLANLGRIASGHTERLDLEPHRTMAGAARALLRNPQGNRRNRRGHRNNNQGRNWWNPRWRDADIEVDPQHAVTEPDLDPRPAARPSTRQPGRWRMRLWRSVFRLQGPPIVVNPLGSGRGRGGEGPQANAAVVVEPDRCAATGADRCRIRHGSATRKVFRRGPGTPRTALRSSVSAITCSR